MADLTIFQLTQILPGAVDGANDLIPLWDNSDSETKKITVNDLRTVIGLPALTSGQIWVGSSSNIATARALTLSATGGTFALSNTGVFTFPNANGSTRGLLTAADWTTFNSKQGALTLTTTGSSGAATLVGTTLNIPNYASGGAVNWSETFASGTQASSQWSPNNAASNVNAVITPKGTGALVSDLPDGTATGGNARGAYAVDLQHQRSAATQIASAANSAILSGLNNSSLSARSVVVGGSTNTITAGDSSVIVGGVSNTVNSAATGLSFIGGGTLNSITSTYSFIGGGDSNATAGNYCVIGGGQQNTMGGAASAFIGGGFSNYGFNNYFVICGGYDNTNGGASAFVGGGQSNNLSSGSYAVLVGGDSNYISGNWSTIGGGYQNQVNEQFTSIAGGRQANATLYGMQAYSSGQFSALADAQMASIQMRRAITGTAITELFLDGSSVQAILPATNTLWMVRIQLVAICTAAGNGTTVVGASYVTERHAGIKRLNTTTSLVGSVQTIGTAQADATMSTSVVTITADDTNEALKVEFTPPSTAGSTTTFRVVATIQLTQVKY
jgi:hypothetical protein